MLLVEHLGTSQPRGQPIRRVDLDTVMAESDFVVVACLTALIGVLAFMVPAVREVETRLPDAMPVQAATPPVAENAS